MLDVERRAIASLFLGRKISLTRLVRPPSVEAAIEQAYSELCALGATVLYPSHPDYPAQFLLLEKPPLFLSCVGNVEALHARKRLAVVGSRELSGRAAAWLEDHLSVFLKRVPEAVIVSGGARGADQSAHKAALRAGKPTVVFLPSGLGRIFPNDLRDWVEPVLNAGGVFVSQYAPSEGTRRGNFEARNLLIASLSHKVFVAEASRRSGSMMTARLARDLGREIAVLPSFPGEGMGAGTLDLMIDGNAVPMRDSEDLVAFVSSSSIPSAFERPARSDREESVGQPHRNERRQLTLAGSALGDDVENVISDDEGDTDDHAATASVTSVRRCPETDADEREENARGSEGGAFMEFGL